MHRAIVDMAPAQQLSSAFDEYIPHLIMVIDSWELGAYSSVASSSYACS